MRRTLLGLVCVLILNGCAGGSADAGECTPDEDTLTASGAYSGTARCPNGNEWTLDMSVYQAPGDNDLRGTLSLDWPVRYQDGLFDVTLRHVVRTQISDAELDDDGVVSGRLLTETIMPTASAPDFSMELTADHIVPRPNAWSGTISQLNGANDPVVTCDVVLARLGTDLPDFPVVEADAGTD